MTFLRTTCKLSGLDMQAVLVILAVSLLARLVVCGVGALLTADSIAYQISALALLHGFWPDLQLINSPGYGVFVAPELLQGNLSDFFIERTPGYPLLLMAEIVGLAMAKGTVTTGALYTATVVVQSALGCLNAVLTAVIAMRLFGKRSLALWSGLLVALSPNLLRAEHLVLSETLYTASLLGMVLLTLPTLPGQDGKLGAQARALLPVGLLSGWLVWVRPIGLVTPAVGAVYLWLLGYRRQVAGYLAPVVLFIGVWVGFQYQTHGLLALTAGGGMNQLYKVIDYMDLASPLHTPFKRELAESARHFTPQKTFSSVNTVHTLHLLAERQKPPAERRPMWQIYKRDDAQAREISLEAIRREPFKYLQVTARQFWRVLMGATPWDPLLLFWSPIFLLGMLGMLTCYRTLGWRHPSFLLPLVAWGHLLLYPVLTMGEARYRVPLEPLFAIFAVYAVGKLLALQREAPNLPASQPV